MRTKRNHYDWEQIAEWRNSLNLSYKEIIEKCMKEWGKAPAKSTISHHFSPTTAKKSAARQRSYREGVRGRLSHKVTEFKVKKAKDYVWPGNKNSEKPRENIRVKLKGYKQKKEEAVAEDQTHTYTIEDVIQYLTKEHGLDLEAKTAVSALTGDTIDLTKEFHLDHWDNKAGNTLENMCILSRKENMFKGDLTMSELLELCRKTIEKFA